MTTPFVPTGWLAEPSTQTVYPSGSMEPVLLMSGKANVVLTSTASVLPSVSKSCGRCSGLCGSLHALAIASIAAATAHQFRPTVRTTRLLQLGVHRSRGARTGPPAGSGTQPTQHRIATPSPTWSTKSLLLLRRHGADTPQSGVAPASHRHQGGSRITSRRRYRTRQLPHAALDAGIGLLEHRQRLPHGIADHTGLDRLWVKVTQNQHVPLGSPEARADFVALGEIHDDNEVGRAHVLRRHKLRPVHREIHAMARGRRNRLGWRRPTGSREAHRVDPHPAPGERRAQ